MVSAGLREIEVGSYVPARLLPQMADTAKLVQHALRHNGVTVMALVPNVRGAQAAIEAGVHKITLPVSASREHSLANVRKTPEEMVEVVRDIVRLRDELAPHVHVEAGLSDTTGMGNPAQVRRLFSRLREVIGNKTGRPYP